VKEWNVKELPTANEGVIPTGEFGVAWVDGRWERNGQKLLCPLSRMILQYQPRCTSWMEAAAAVTGWTLARTFAFKMTMGKVPLRVTSVEATKGHTDAILYDLLHKLSRKTHRSRPDQELPST
jgi:hypothetical protein